MDEATKKDPAASQTNQGSQASQTKPNFPGFSYGEGAARVDLEVPLFLAPMAGSTEQVFRRICHRFGSGQGVTELVSARGIRYGGLESSAEYLAIRPDLEGPVAIQLFGADPYDFEVAATQILEDPTLGQCVAIDINMGCPVKKVRKTGAGSSLMETPDLAAEIVAATKQVCTRFDKSLSVKFRLGIDEDSCNAPEYALRMAEAGADLLCLHARTAEQFYRGEADWSWMPKLRQKLDDHGFRHLPLVGNGDLDGPDTLRVAMAQGACQGYMVGRAAQGNPWIFSSLRRVLEEAANEESGEGATSSPSTIEELKPTTEERCAIIREHYLGLVETLGEARASREFRALFAMYLKGARGAAHWRAQTGKISSRYEVEKILEAMMAEDIWARV